MVPTSHWNRQIYKVDVDRFYIRIYRLCLFHITILGIEPAEQASDGQARSRFELIDIPDLNP